MTDIDREQAAVDDDMLINAMALAEQIVHQVTARKTHPRQEWREIERMAVSLAELAQQIGASAPDGTSQP